MWRLGCKECIAKDIIQYFPKHDMYIELFFGAGGIFFNKPKAKYNILNDNDKILYNFYLCLIDEKKRNELLEHLELFHVNQDIWQYWKDKEDKSDVENALLFVISQMTYYGKNSTLSYGLNNDKQMKIQKITENYKQLINDLMIMNKDFRDVLSSIHFIRKEDDRDRAFVYADPPYIKTDNNYQNGFTEQDLIDLFKILTNSGIKFAISHNKNEYFRELCNQYKLKIITVCERQSLKKRNIELLAVNYEINQLNLFEV